MGGDPGVGPSGYAADSGGNWSSGSLSGSDFEKSFRCRESPGDFPAPVRIPKFVTFGVRPPVLPVAFPHALELEVQFANWDYGTASSTDVLFTTLYPLRSTEVAHFAASRGAGSLA